MCIWVLISSLLLSVFPNYFFAKHKLKKHIYLTFSTLNITYFINFKISIFFFLYSYISEIGLCLTINGIPQLPLVIFSV